VAAGALFSVIVAICLLAFGLYSSRPARAARGIFVRLVRRCGGLGCHRRSLLT